MSDPQTQPTATPPEAPQPERFIVEYQGPTSWHPLRINVGPSFEMADEAERFLELARMLTSTKLPLRVRPATMAETITAEGAA